MNRSPASSTSYKVAKVITDNCSTVRKGICLKTVNKSLYILTRISNDRCPSARSGICFKATERNTHFIARVAPCPNTRNGVCLDTANRNPSSVGGPEPDPNKCRVGKRIIVNKEFMKSVKDNNLDCVAKFVEMLNIDINLTGGPGSEFKRKTPLMVASKYGRTEAIELLSERSDLDYNRQDRDGKTALFIAVQENQSVVVKQLLTFTGVDINKEDNNKNTPLIVASENGRYEIVRMLLERKGIDIDKKNSRGQTAYELSKENNHAGTGELLIAHVRDRENKLDVRRCFHSVKTGNVEALQTCLAKGADINARESDGGSLLISAVTYKKPEILRFLIEDPRTDVNAQDHRGSTALIIATRIGTPGDVKLLLSREDINIYLRDDQELTAFEYAEKRSRFHAKRKDLASIVEEISDLEQQHKKDLFDASRRGNMVLLKNTLDKGIDINTRIDHAQSTPLISASQMAKEKVVEYLLTLPNIDVNLQTSNGYTALMMATIASDSKIVKLLVEGESDNLALTQMQRANIVMNTKDTDLTLENAKGQTALDIAKGRGHKDIIASIRNSSNQRGFFRAIFRR